jgi:hypothetical protein
MHTITTIGLDIAKPVFQVHGIGAQGKVIIRRQLARRRFRGVDLAEINVPGSTLLRDRNGIAQL